MRSIRGNVRALVGVSAVLPILVVLAPAGAAPGDLDPSFGAGGTVETQISSQALVKGLAIQADGKIVAGGNAYPPSNAVALARYELNGKLDTAFGSGGIVTGPVFGTVQALALQPDGKILLVGNGFDSNTRRAFFSMIRYRPDGTPDATFGSDGLVRGPDGGADSVALQADGRIVVAGTEPEDYAFKLVRLNADGTLDPSFGSNGSVRALLGYAASASAVIVQPDGRILAAGSSVPGNPPPPPPPPPAPPPPPPPGPPPLPWEMTLLRYNPDGSLDPSFGSSGVVTTRLGLGTQINSLAASVALQPDGSIVAAAENDRHFVLARYGADGALDTTFGPNGIVTTELQASGFPSGLALQTDGRIVIAGSDGVARYRSNGTPDPAFGFNGVARANIFNDAVVLQQDGRIVTGGTLHNNFALSRFADKSPTTISAAPAAVAYGGTAVVRGTLARKQSGVVVKVTQRACYGFSTRVVATTTTAPDGSWRARVSPRSRTSLKAMVDGEASFPRIVQVRPKLMLKRLSRTHVRARGLAGRSLADQTVILQRFAKGRWVDGRKITLRRIASRGSSVISQATFRARAGQQRLRLLLRRNTFACYASSASPTIRG
jgi:uncharacterized delta-60 repeat protein